MIVAADPWAAPPTLSTDSLTWGSAYLQAVRQVAPRTHWIEVPGDSAQRLRSCTWIGQSVHGLNGHLGTLLHTALAVLQSPPGPLRIWAAPLASYAGIDGFFNAQAQPPTLVIDPSRARPDHWLRLVVHEAAHALSPTPGHGVDYGTHLNRLCLALDLPLPPDGTAATLRQWPPYQPHPQGCDFWQGTTELPFA